MSPHGFSVDSHGPGLTRKESWTPHSSRVLMHSAVILRLLKPQAGFRAPDQSASCAAVNTVSEEVVSVPLSMCREAEESPGCLCSHISRAMGELRSAEGASQPGSSPGSRHGTSVWSSRWPVHRLCHVAMPSHLCSIYPQMLIRCHHPNQGPVHRNRCRRKWRG